VNVRHGNNGLVVYTIPVPYGWSIEQAWEAAVREDPLPAGLPAGWANVILHANGRFQVDWL
jgi:hypothetical protein